MLFGEPIYRERNNTIQAILPYRPEDKKTWRQKSKQGFTNMNQARSWTITAMRELEAMDDPSNEYSNITLQEGINIFFEARKDKLAHATKLQYEQAFNHLEHVLDKKVVTFKPIDFNFILSDKFKPGERFNFQRNVQALFNFFIQELEIISLNPMRKQQVSYKVQKQKEIMTLDDYYNLLYPTLESKKELQLMTEVNINTGVRVSELLGLTISDIKPYEIDVNKQFDKILKEFTELKNKKPHTVPITEKLYNKIQKYIKSKPLDYRGRIFTVRYAIYLNNLKEATRKVGYDNFTPHCFRHSFATHLISSGVDFKTVAELLGDTVEVVMKTYSQRDEQRIESIRELMG